MIALLGPSLPAAEARRICRCEVWPPARQGDVWRAVRQGPKVIALIDGVFESEPSVWHHEILDALDAGIAVVGGASMGALRAAELERRGMMGVGTIFRWYQSGEIDDDAEVALLHADGEHGFRPLTVPQVNVRHAAAEAVRARVLSRQEATALVRASGAIFYQERTWPIALAAARFPPGTRARWDAWAARGLPDLKAEDARATLREAARLRRSRAASPREPAPSSLVRRRRLAAEGISALWSRTDAKDLAAQGLRRLMLAGVARELGLVPAPDELAAAERRWARALEVRGRAALLRRTGLDEARLLRACQDLALEQLAIDHADRLLADGPSADEGLAFEARLRGVWPRER